MDLFMKSLMAERWLMELMLEYYDVIEQLI